MIQRLDESLKDVLDVLSKHNAEIDNHKEARGRPSKTKSENKGVRIETTKKTA